MEINKRSRAELKQYFVKNAIPTEKNFAELIDGMLNQKDDGIAKLPGDALSIEASGDDTSQKKAIQFYTSFADASPTWVLSLNPRQNPTEAATAKPGFSISDGAGNSRLFIDRRNGNVGIGTVAPAAKLQVAGGAIMPQGGSGSNAGILFPENPGGGGGDAAWIRYYPRSGEHMVLEIGTLNDPQDHIALMASGNVGVGTNDPTHKLHVRAADAVGLFESTGTQASLRLTTKEGMDNRVEIANRPGGQLALWTAAGGDSLTISKDGQVSVTRSLSVNGPVSIPNGRLGVGTSSPRVALDVQGDAYVGRSLNIAAASDGTNGGILNIHNETNRKFWHITIRSNAEDKLIFWSNNTTAYRAVLQLSMDGNVEIDGTVQAPRGAMLQHIGIGTQAHGATSYPYETIQMVHNHNLRIWFATKERFVFGNDGSFTIRFDQGYWVFQADGNLVKFRSNGTVLWALNQVSGKWGWS
ncbi:hypothetical protein [Sorangium sp. So ce385]|uniref:hypothetical protein n=1 Tax=Sorangium sp. So ce385 TaxID=3133308 RepID=UPI003F5B6702